MVKQINVKVNPNSSQINLTEMANGTIKVNLTATPEKREANEQLLEVLADKYKVDTSRIKIKRGKTSPRKKVIIK